MRIGCLDFNDLARVGTRIAQVTDLLSSVDDKKIVLIENVVDRGRTIKVVLEVLPSRRRARRVTLLSMVGRGEKFQFNQVLWGVKYQPVKMRNCA